MERTPDNEEEDAPSGPDFAAAVRDIAFSAAIVLYFAGFTYRSYYFEQLGLPSSLVAADPYATFVYAYDVFSPHGKLIVATTLGIAIAYLLLRWLAGRLAIKFAPQNVILVVFAALVIFPQIANWSRDAATCNVDTVRRQTVDKAALVELAPETVAAYTKLGFPAAVTNRRVSLIGETADTYYFLMKYPGDLGTACSGTQPPRELTVAVPKKDVLHYAVELPGSDH